MSEQKKSDQECTEIVETVIEYLESDQTTSSETTMRQIIARTDPDLALLSAEEIVCRILKRSCAQEAPAELRIKIQSAIYLAKTEN